MPLDGWFEWLPSAGWLGLLLVPTVIQLPDAELSSSRDQVIASTAILLMLTAADALAWSRARRGGFLPATDPRSALGRAGVIALAAVVVVSTGLSVAFMPRIPLIVAIMGEPGAHSEAREVALKLGRGAPWLGPLCAISLALLAPVAVLSIWALRWRVASVGLALWAVAYGLSTTARFPVIVLAFGLGIGWSAVSVRASRLLLGIAAIGTAVACASLVALMAVPSPMFSPEVADRSREPGFALKSGDLVFPPTIADRHRVWSVMPPGERPAVGPVIGGLERFLYRAFFTPADVSIRWYQYFCTPERRLGIVSVVHRPPDGMRPSRVIGHWAYRDRFPTRYLDSVNAYASLDADAYARGGVLASLFAGAVLSLARVTLLPLRGDAIEARICYGVGIALLFLLPVQASLQAILVIHGLGALIVLSGLVVLRVRWMARHRRNAVATGRPVQDARCLPR